jgi:hypothetical protein
MTTPANRFSGWIDSLSKLWSDSLGNWLGKFIGAGFIGFADIVGKKFSKPLTPLIQKLIDTDKIPPEVKPLFDEILNPSGEIAAMLGSSVSNAMVGGALSRIIDAFFLPMSYGLNQLTKNVVLSPDLMFSLERRNLLTRDYIFDIMEKLGYDKGLTDKWRQLYDTYYSVSEAISLWRRGIISEGYLKTTLEAHGYTAGQIDGFKELAKVLPSSTDIVRFAVKEAYTPEIAERFGQYQDFPDKAMVDAEKIGLDKDLLSKYWAAHWDLPSVGQAFEMYHRGVITKDELTLLLRALDIMPFWRERLTQIAYNPYTRVDARRMWDLGVLNDTELKKAYTDIGYDNDHADTMVLWTKIFQTFPDLIARYKNGYINLDDVKNELLAMGMAEDRAQFLIETKVKPEEASRVAKERDLTKAEIMKGLKKGVIQRAEATEFLIDMGYDESEAKFILAINVPEEETTPALKLKELTKSDIMSALKKGLITPEDALARLIKLRYTSDDAQFIISLALATATKVTEVTQKELTKADITKGVKLGVITAEEGYLMLQDIGYEAWEAAYILTISVPATTGSPDSYSEFKKLTQTWRASQGLPAKEIATELIEAERDLIASRQAYDFGKKRGADESAQAPLSKAVSDAQYRYRQLLAKYKLSAS